MINWQIIIYNDVLVDLSYEINMADFALANESSKIDSILHIATSSGEKSLSSNRKSNNSTDGVTINN